MQARAQPPVRPVLDLESRRLRSARRAERLKRKSPAEAGLFFSTDRVDQAGAEAAFFMVFFIIGFFAAFFMGAEAAMGAAIGAAAGAAGVAAKAPMLKAEAMTAMRVFMDLSLGKVARANCSA
jgi:hypothetical protein